MVAGLSRAGFAAQFRRIVGVPAAQYVTGLRRTRPEDGLTRTDETLAVISANVGYSNEYAFATASRRRHGVSLGAGGRTAEPLPGAGASEAGPDAVMIGVLQRHRCAEQ